MCGSSWRRRCGICTLSPMRVRSFARARGRGSDVMRLGVSKQASSSALVGRAPKRRRSGDRLAASRCRCTLVRPGNPVLPHFDPARQRASSLKIVTFLESERTRGPRSSRFAVGRSMQKTRVLCELRLDATRGGRRRERIRSSSLSGLGFAPVAWVFFYGRRSPPKPCAPSNFPLP